MSHPVFFERNTLVKALILVALLLFMDSSISGAEGTTMSLSVSEAIRAALENNLDLKVEMYNPAQFEADINRNRSIYDPTLSFQTNYNAALGQQAGDSRQLDLNSSISRQLWTGGTASLFFNNSYINVNAPEYHWQTGLGVGFSQPLLKNAGRESTELAINVSRLSKFASIEHLNGKLLFQTAQVRNEYFKLYNLRQQLDVKKVSLELATKILSETRTRVSAGVLPAMEILNAEFGVVTREKDLNDAIQAVSDQVDVLRILLQLDKSVTDIVLTDVPQRTPYSVSEDTGIQKAINRPDIREQKRNLESSEMQTRVFNSKTKPDLTLSASASLVGIDRSYSQDLSKLTSGDYPNWSIGLNFTYPLGNLAAENDYRKSRLKVEQNALQIRSLEEVAINDVRTAVRGIASAYKQIEVADRGRAFAEERLKSFIRKNEVGLATTKDVLDVENDLATAKSNQFSALVTYVNSLTKYWQATGELLERENVHIVEGDVDKLYKFIR